MARSWTHWTLVLLLLLPLGCNNKRKVEDHVLDRIGYGPDAWSQARIRAIGARAYVEEQLRPHLLDDSALEADLAARYPTLAMPYADLRRVYHEYGAPNGGVGRVGQELGFAKILRATYGKRQLEQVLVDFWFNHLNVSIKRDLVRWAGTDYERDVIRPHVLGRFEDMLLASARSTAMINYLDNQVNFREGFKRGSRFYGINENYARELLELHTLGAEAPFTLEDIQEVARAFTGWTTFTLSELPHGSDGFYYIDDGHDKGAKTILGELFIPAGGGMEDGEMVISYLARHPLTAERIARKLCARFVSENPPAALVQQAKDVYLSTDGDLYQVTRTILTSDAFLEATGFRTKVKRPLAFIASTARAVGVANVTDFTIGALKELERMGETPYAAEPPTGYPEASGAWVSEGSFLRRVNYAYYATNGGLGFTPLGSLPGTAEEVVAKVAGRLLMPPLSPATSAAGVAIANGHSTATEVPAIAAALVMSPAFQTH